uniref:Uncharacterized protein n=1 Tax=Cacopsylla melanoneura TaxID=428564 RepID=A0A8D8VN37_9HEMI
MVLEDSHGNYGISQFREFCGSPGKTSLSTRAATESATPKKPPAKTSSDSVIGLVATSLVDLSSSSPIPNFPSSSPSVRNDRRVREWMGSNGGQSNGQGVVDKPPKRMAHQCQRANCRSDVLGFESRLSSEQSSSYLVGQPVCVVLHPQGRWDKIPQASQGSRRDLQERLRYNIVLVAQYIPGTYNNNADNLSRSIVLPEQLLLLPPITSQVLQLWGKPVIDLFCVGEFGGGFSLCLQSSS